MLAQHCSLYGKMYPYFSELTELTTAEFTKFFAFGEKLQSMKTEDAQEALSFFNPLIEFIRLGVESGAVSGKLVAQKVASLGLLSDLEKAARTLAQGKGDRRALIAKLSAALPKIPTVEVPKEAAKKGLPALSAKTDNLRRPVQFICSAGWCGVDGRSGSRAGRCELCGDAGRLNPVGSVEPLQR